MAPYLTNITIKNSVKASFAMENAVCSKRATSISDKFLNGKISSQEAIKQIGEYHNIKRIK